jgi:hypothetical protein
LTRACIIRGPLFKIARNTHSRYHARRPFCSVRPEGA